MHPQLAELGERCLHEFVKMLQGAKSEEAWHVDLVSRIGKAEAAWQMARIASNGLVLDED